VRLHPLTWRNSVTFMAAHFYIANITALYTYDDQARPLCEVEPFLLLNEITY